METLAASPGLLVLAGLGLLAVVVIVLGAILLGRRLDLRIGSIHAELAPNGGSTMRDAVDRIEAKCDAAIRRIEALEALPQPPPSVALAVVNAPPPE